MTEEYEKYVYEKFSNLSNLIYLSNDSLYEPDFYALWLLHPTISIRPDRFGS